MRVFVAGATGVIGRRVVPMLVQRGLRVTAVARSPDKRAVLEQQGAAAVEIDLFDPKSLRRVLGGHDAVINLATHIPSSSMRMLFRWAWRETDRIRREGSAALVDAAIGAGVRRFVQESFAPVYEDGGDRWIEEQWPLRPATYNRTVLDAERSASRFTTSGGVGVILRFAVFYGGDSRASREMVGMIRKGWSPIPGDPDAFVSSVSHDDAATATVAALEIPAGAYNVNDNEPLRRREWVDSFADALSLPHPRPLPVLVTRLGGSTMRLLSRSLRLSNAKLRAASDWSPRWPSVRDAWPSIAPELLVAANSGQTHFST
jgi:nucleoside-diphosphate-sugar epimerase